MLFWQVNLAILAAFKDSLNKDFVTNNRFHKCYKANNGCAKQLF